MKRIAFRNTPLGQVDAGLSSAHFMSVACLRGAGKQLWELGPSEKEAGVKPTPAGRERLKPRKKNPAK